MSDFYIYLPSNAPSAGAGVNTLNNYTTSLSKPLNLEGHFEVGISQFTYPTRIYNISYGDIEYYSFVLGYLNIVTIPQGYYPTIQEIMEEINMAFESTGEGDLFEYKVDEIKQKILIQLKKPSGAKEEPQLNLSPNLTRVTGLPDTMKGAKWWAGTNYDIRDNHTSFYIYTDIVEYSHIGSVTAPLLGVIPIDYSVPFDTSVNYQPKSISYKRIRGNSIPTILIELRNKVGDLIPFIGTGEVLLVLHIRRAEGD